MSFKVLMLSLLDFFQMDKVAILGDAIDYINELQEKVKLYETELNEIDAKVPNDETAEMVLSDMTEMSKVTTDRKRIEVLEVARFLYIDLELK